MKIAFVTLSDPCHSSLRIRSDYYKANCLENQSAEITCIGPLKEKYFRFFNVKGKIYRILKRNYESLREPIILKGYAEQIQQKLLTLDVDIVFSYSSIPLSYLNCRQPIVFWVDATFAGMVDFYPEFTNLSKESLRKGNAQEQAALSNCTLAIFSSEWAAATALENYQVDPLKIKVVPFGGNFACNRTREDIDKLLISRSTKELKLLFFGIDWHRKGGDLAIEIAKKLNKQGLKTELTIVGCYPLVEEALPDFVKVHGFIDKTSEAGLDRIKKVLSETHFLIHPARAEAFGCVLPEANSFGIPCLTTNVGGIPTVIKDNINGRLFAPTDGIDSYSDFIMKSFANYEGYKDLARSSFQEYQARLNWDVAGMTIKKMLVELI